MLIWPRKREVNARLTNEMNEMYGPVFMKMFKPWELSVILRQIRRHFGNKKSISILDFGVGQSPFGAYLNHLGYRFVTCLDKKKGWHRRMNIVTYNARYGSHVKYVKTDITSDEYTDKHDVIFSASTLEHIGNEARAEVVRALSKHLNPGGLVIHIVDYDGWDRLVNIKELIDNCGVPIPHRPEETPGYGEFRGPPKYAWWQPWPRAKRMVTRVAFFNEKQRRIE